MNKSNNKKELAKREFKLAVLVVVGANVGDVGLGVAEEQVNGFLEEL